MRNQYFPNGIYLAKKASKKFGNLIDHYGVVEVGNVLNIVQFDEKYPIVYQQTIELGLNVDYLREDWEILDRVGDQHLNAVYRRLTESFNNPTYNLFENNCEHFARYVIEGKKYSGQLQGAGLVSASLFVAWLVTKK